MANNRMYFLHRPSGKAVRIGKRLERGWYDVPENIGKQIEGLFDLLGAGEIKGSQDDFCIALEDNEHATLALSDWDYDQNDESGLFNLNEIYPQAPDKNKEEDFSHGDVIAKFSLGLINRDGEVHIVATKDGSAFLVLESSRKEDKESFHGMGKTRQIKISPTAFAQLANGIKNE